MTSAVDLAVGEFVEKTLAARHAGQLADQAHAVYTELFRAYDKAAKDAETATSNLLHFVAVARRDMDNVIPLSIQNGCSMAPKKGGL